MSKQKTPIHPKARTTIILGVVAISFIFAILLFPGLDWFKHRLIVLLMSSLSTICGIGAVIMGSIAIIDLVRLRKKDKENSPRGLFYAISGIIAGLLSVLVGISIVSICLSIPDMKVEDSGNNYSQTKPESFDFKYSYFDHPEYRLNGISTLILPDSCFLTHVKGIVDSSNGPRSKADILLKTDKDGKEIWRKEVCVVSTHIRREVVVLREHGIYYMTSQRDSLTRKNTYYLNNCSLEGENLGKFRIREELNTFLPMNMFSTADNNLIYTGWLKQESSEDGVVEKKTIITKIDLSGKIIWQKLFPRQEHEINFGAIKTYDNGFVTTGYIRHRDYDDPNSRSILSVVKFNDIGDKIWEIGLRDSIQFEPMDICETKDNNLLICGREDLHKENINKVYKLNESGEIIWETKVGKFRKEEDDRQKQAQIIGIAPWKDNSCIIAGSIFLTDFKPNQRKEGFIVRSALYLGMLDSDGNVLNSFINDVGTFRMMDIDRISDNEYLISGTGNEERPSETHSMSGGPKERSMILVRYRGD